MIDYSHIEIIDGVSFKDNVIHLEVIPCRSMTGDGYNWYGLVRVSDEVFSGYFKKYQFKEYGFILL